MPETSTGLGSGLRSGLPLNVAHASPSDAGSIAALLRKAFLPFARYYTAGAYAETVVPPERVLERLAEGPVLVARLDSRVVGTASLVVRPGEQAVLRGVAVDPEYWGQGVGTALVATALAVCRQEHVSEVRLCTMPFLVPARRLYERFGFVADEPLDDMHGTPIIHMVLPSAALARHDSSAVTPPCHSSD